MDTTVKSTLRHLRAFQMVARLNNIRRAAEAVHLTQPAVTLAIAKLECQADTILFDRQSRGTYPTAAGEILSARIDRMFNQIEASVAAITSQDRRQALGYGSIADRITRSQIRALVTLSHSDPRDEGEVSRSSVQRTVRDLERLLGVDLVRNAAGGPAATAVGAEFGRQLTVALNEVDWGMAEIAIERNRQSGVLRIGALPMTGSFVVGPALNDFARTCPEAMLEVRTGDKSHLTGALMRGEIDLIVGLLHETPCNGETTKEPLVELPYVLVARQGHPLAARGNLGLSDLEGFDWVAPNLNTARREAFDQLVGAMAQKPVANLQASSLSTLRLLVTGSDRLALLTRFEFDHDRQEGGLTDLDFGPIEPAHWLGITTRSNWLPTPLHRRFVALLRETSGLITARGRPKPVMQIAAE